MRLTFLFLVISFRIAAQNPLADSLKLALKNHPQEDTVRAMLLNQLAFEKQFSFPFESIEYSIAARELSEKLNYARGKALSLRYYGLAFWTRGSFEMAIKSLFEGLRIADSCHFTQIQADINGNIGLVYNGMKEYKLALPYFETSLKVQRKLYNLKREIVMLNNIGDCYRGLHQNDQALKYYEESKSLGMPIDYLVETNQRNIGNLYEEQHDFTKAMQYYQDSKKISDRYNAKRERSLIRLAIASIYRQTNKRKLAVQFATEALGIAKAGNLKAMVRDCHLFLSEVNKELGHPEEAFSHLQLFMSYKDSIESLSNKSDIMAAKMEYEIQKRETEINYLKNISKQKEIEIQLRNYQLFLAVIILILFATLIAFIIYHYTTQRNQNILLKEKNDTIDRFNNNLKDVNENLEILVKERTAVLEEQNKALEEYAYFNAHRLRAPVASILGLIHLLTDKQQHIDKEMQDTLLTHLLTSSEKLDCIIREINLRIEDGLSAYPPGENDTPND